MFLMSLQTYFKKGMYLRKNIQYWIIYTPNLLFYPFPLDFKSSVMTIIVINLVTLIVVHLKIEVFKKIADRPGSASTYLEINDGYSKNMHRIIVIIICIVFFTLLMCWVFSFNIRTDVLPKSDPFISRLILLFIVHFILLNLIPFIIIVKNFKLYNFIKKQIKDCFYCF